MSKKLFVGSLPFKITEDQLKELFSSFGAVEDAKIVTDRETSRSRGFGFVTMTSAEAADAAIARLDESDFEGRKLTVNEAKELERR